MFSSQTPLCHRNGKHVMRCLSYDPSCELHKKLVSHNGCSVGKKNKIKWRLFCWRICSGLVCRQLAAMTMMTYWQRLRGDTPSFIALPGFGAGDFSFGASSGEIQTGLMTPAGLLDEDGWGYLAVSSKRPIWLCQKSTREREDNRGLVSIGKCSLPHMHSLYFFFFKGWNSWYFCFYDFL